jgi:hypothetical protein
MKRIGIQLGVVYAVAFILNLIWESLHVSLYDCSEGCYVAMLASLSFLPVWVRATFFDAFFITILYGALAFLHRCLLWYGDWRVYDVALIIIMGLAVATAIEMQALAEGKWAYTSFMPLVPFLNIGLTPFAQLALLSLSTYAVTRRLALIQ